jgi:hypothetical protein
MTAQIAMVAKDQPTTSTSGGRVPSRRRKFTEAPFTFKIRIPIVGKLYTAQNPLRFQ